MTNDSKESKKEQIEYFFEKHVERIRKEFLEDEGLKEHFEEDDIYNHYTNLIEKHKSLLELQFEFKELVGQSKEKQIETIMNLHDIWIWLFDESHNVLYYPYPEHNFGKLVKKDLKRDYFESFLKDWSLKPGQGTAGFAMATGQGVCIPNTFVDVRGSVAIEDLLLRNMSYINVPVFPDQLPSSARNLIAIVCLVFPVPGAWKCSSDQCGFFYEGEKSKNDPCIYDLFKSFVKNIKTGIQEFWELVRERSIKDKYHKLVELGEEDTLLDVNEKSWWDSFFESFLTHDERESIRDFIGITAWSLSLFDERGDIRTYNDIIDKKVFFENFISLIKNLSRQSLNRETSIWNYEKPVSSDSSVSQKLLGDNVPVEIERLNPEVDMVAISFGKIGDNVENILQIIFKNSDSANNFNNNENSRNKKILQEHLDKVAAFWSEKDIIDRLEQNGLIPETIADKDSVSRRILRFKLISGIKSLSSKLLVESFLPEKKEMMNHNLKIFEFLFKVLKKCDYPESKTNVIDESFKTIIECLKDDSIMAVAHWTNHENLRYNLSKEYPKKWYMIDEVDYIWSDEKLQNKDNIKAWIDKELSNPETQRVYETIMNVVADEDMRDGYFAKINSSAGENSVVSGLTKQSLETKISSNIIWKKEGLGEYSPLKELFAIKPDNSEFAYLLIAERIDENLKKRMKALKNDEDGGKLIQNLFVETNYGELAVFIKWGPLGLSGQMFLSSCCEKEIDENGTRELWLTSKLLEGINEEIIAMDGLKASDLKECFEKCSERAEAEAEEYIPTYYLEGNDWKLYDIFKSNNDIPKCESCIEDGGIYNYFCDLTSRGIVKNYGLNTVSLFPIHTKAGAENKKLVGIAGFWGSHIDTSYSKENLIDIERYRLFKGAIDYAEAQIVLRNQVKIADKEKNRALFQSHLLSNFPHISLKYIADILIDEIELNERCYIVNYLKERGFYLQQIAKGENNSNSQDDEVLVDICSEIKNLTKYNILKKAEPIWEYQSWEDLFDINSDGFSFDSLIEICNPGNGKGALYTILENILHNAIGANIIQNKIGKKSLTKDFKIKIECTIEHSDKNNVFVMKIGDTTSVNFRQSGKYFTNNPTFVQSDDKGLGLHSIYIAGEYLSAGTTEKKPKLLFEDSNELIKGCTYTYVFYFPVKM